MVLVMISGGSCKVLKGQGRPLMVGLGEFLGGPKYAK